MLAFDHLDLRGADLGDADLGDADLGEVTITPICSDEATIWPDSFDPPSSDADTCTQFDDSYGD